MAARRPSRPPDWAAIEAEYLAGGVSYQQLADKHGVSKRTVERRGTAGDWPSRCRQVVGAVSAGLDAAVTAARVQQAADDGIMSRDEVLRRLTAIARGGMHMLVDWGPAGVAFRPSSDLPEDVRSLVAEVGESVNAHGRALRLKVIDPLSALKELARYHGVDQPEEDDPQGPAGSNAGRMTIVPADTPNWRDLITDE